MIFFSLFKGYLTTIRSLVFGLMSFPTPQFSDRFPVQFFGFFFYSFESRPTVPSYFPYDVEWITVLCAEVKNKDIATALWSKGHVLKVFLRCGVLVVFFSSSHCFSPNTCSESQAMFLGWKAVLMSSLHLCLLAKCCDPSSPCCEC